MKILIKAEDFIENSIIILALGHIFILNWLGLGIITKGAVFFLVWAHILLHGKTYIQTSYIWLICVILIYLLGSFLVFGGTFYVFARNFWNIMLGTCLFCFFLWLLTYKPVFLQKVFDKLGVPLNLFAILNIPVIILQNAGYTQLLGVGQKEWNTGIIDKINGLCGIGGGPVLIMFFLFCFCYNLLCYCKTGRHKKIFLLYNFGILVFTAWASTINQTRAFFVISILCILGVYVSAGYKSLTVKSVLQFGIIGGIIIGTIFVIYNVTELGTVFDSIIGNEIKKNGLEKLLFSYRIGLFADFFRQGKRLFTGYGIGRWIIYGSATFNKSGFYSTELGDIIWSGGVLLLILIIELLYSFVYRVLKKHLASIFVVFFFVVICFYDCIFCSIGKLICFVFYVYVCRSFILIGEEKRDNCFG